MKRLAIFASGNGSNFQSILEAVNSGALEAEICLLVCDCSDAFVLERAKTSGVPVYLFNPKEYPNKAAFETEIVLELAKHRIDFICLAGYMRLIGPTLLAKYEGRMVNIHPSLLPHFPGKDAIGQALAARVKKTGVTIHYIDAGMDTGPIIAQEEVEITESDTRDTLQKKIQMVEHRLYPSVLASILNEIHMSVLNNIS